MVCAAAGCTSDWTNPSFATAFGSSASTGDVYSKDPKKVPRNPPATVTANSHPSSRTSLSRLSFPSITRLYAHRAMRVQQQ
jgi:hypothetical protein